VRKPTREELASIGADSESKKVMDSNADPDCSICGGTGDVETPDRARGGHVCPCVFRSKMEEEQSPPEADPEKKSRS